MNQCKANCFILIKRHCNSIHRFVFKKLSFNRWVNPICQFGGNYADTSSRSQIPKPMLVIVHSKICGSCGHCIACNSIPRRYIFIFLVQKLCRYKCCCGVAGRESISPETIWPLYPCYGFLRLHSNTHYCI